MFIRKIRFIVAASIAASITAFGGPGIAQQASTDPFIDAFSGVWRSFETGNAAGSEGCSVNFDNSGSAGTYTATSEGCVAPLSDLAKWLIEDGQILLFKSDGNPVAILGGNQLRISGEFSENDKALVLERTTGNNYSRQINNAVGQYRCLFRGFSATCATKEELQLPDFQDGAAQVTTVVNLNVRNQPRRDATVIGMLPSDSSVSISQCLVAADGLWCSAAFGDQKGWFARTAIREDTWPITTFIAVAGDS